MDEQTKRALYATKVKAHFHNLTQSNLVKKLQQLDDETVRYLTTQVTQAYHKGTPAIEVAEMVKFYTDDLSAI